MQVQSSAATLALGNVDFDSIPGENANRGAIQSRKRHAANAADKQRHASTLRTFGGIHAAKIGKREVALHTRRESIQVGDSQELQQSATARQALQARALVEAHQPRIPRQAAERRQDLPVEVRSHLALQPATLVVLLDLRACALQQASVGYARGTSRLAIHAAQAAVNMGDEGIPQRQPTLVNQHHLIDAPARRIHLRPQCAVRRALVQAQSAVDTLRVQVPRGFLARGEVGDRLFRHWSCDCQKRNLPRFRMSLGSSAIFTARMLSRSVGIGPQALMWCRVSEGQWSTAMLTFDVYASTSGSAARIAATCC